VDEIIDRLFGIAAALGVLVLTVWCVASVYESRRCASDPECRLELRRDDWTCTQTAIVSHGKTSSVECVQYTASASR
jgi:hypothetical protein